MSGRTTGGKGPSPSATAGPGGRSPQARLRLLDLFCGAGGCTAGYQRAGFHVTGIDIERQPNYCGDEFIQADALDALDIFGMRIGDFDAVHASPPCQSFSVSCNYRPENRTKYPDLVVPTRELLYEIGAPSVIENVPGAPLIQPVMLCGSGFGLPLRRHRLFETNFPLMGIGCAHGAFPWREDFKHSTNRKRRRVAVLGEWRVPFELQKEASGIDWMTLEELSEAIPPAYTEHIGGYLLAEVNRRAREAA